MKLYLNLPLLGLMLLSFSCKTLEPSQSRSLSSSLGNTQPEAVYEIWRQHIEDEVGQDKLMPDCTPTYFPAQAVTETKGLVVYFHGFTACPQQFFALGKLLAAEGYDVFIPLLPGQGRQPLDGPNGNKDDLTKLPKDSNETRKIELNASNPYQKIVESMNRLAKAGKGEKIVIGLSGGGSLATGAAVFGEDIWTRGLIFAPFYKIPGSQGVLSATMDFFYPKLNVGWGDACKAQRRIPGGRQGVCDFRVEHARGMLNYGITIADMTSKIKVPIQYVGAEGDTAADNGRINEAFSKTPQAKICFYENVPHAMVAANESGKDPFWVPSLERATLDFVGRGTWFPSEGQSKEYGRDRCLVQL